MTVANYKTPRLIKPTLTVIPGKRFRCLIVGKPLRTLMCWLRRDFLSRRMLYNMYKFGGRQYLSPVDKKWLTEHGFCTYNTVRLRLGNRCHKTNQSLNRSLSRVVLPYKTCALYYDREVVELDALMLKWGGVLANYPFPKQFCTLPTIQIPIYNIYLPHGKRNQTPQEEPDEE